MLPQMLSIGGSLLSGLFSNEAARSRQEDAQQFSAEQFANRYQTSVRDMQAAGLNPMLAYQQGGGNAPSSSAASAAGMPDLGQSYLQSKMNSAQIANVEADTRNKEAQASQIEADTARSRAQTGAYVAQSDLFGSSAEQARAMTGQIEAAHKKILEEIKNIPKEGQRLDALVKNLGAEYNILLEKGLTQEQVTGQIRMLARKLLLEGDLLEFDIDAAKTLGNIGREAGQLKPIVDMVRLLLRR